MPKRELLPKLYTLKDRQVVEATIEEWGRDLANPDRIVAAWTFKEKGLVKGLVSTVFLGVDHRLGQVAGSRRPDEDSYFVKEKS